MNDGRSLAAALMLGADGVWVGTRFVPSVESKAPKIMKRRLLQRGYDDMIKSTVWSGRPLRSLRNAYLEDWERNRQGEIRELTEQGIVPLVYELDKLHENGELTEEIEDSAALRPAGVVVGAVNKLGETAREIVDDIVQWAVKALSATGIRSSAASKL